MTDYTYNTGNPIGSTDVRDGLDNLKSFDVLLNSQDDTYQDRLGNTVPTAKGVIGRLGMAVQAWTATTGGTLTDASQTFLNDVTASAGKGNYYAWTGSFPKVVAPGTDPAAVAGFVMRSDAALRSELADNSGSSMIGANSGLTVQGEIDRISSAANRTVLSRIKAKKQAANSPWRQAGPINILGDSMSFGYFASYESGAATQGGMFYNRWASILARMISAELNSGHYITCNPNTFEYGGDVDIAKQTAISGTWEYKVTGDYTSKLPVGGARCSSTVGDYIEFTIPSTFKECWVHYVVQPGGGQIDLSQNGGAATAISSDGSEFTYGVVRISLTPNNQGYTVLRFAKGAGAGEVGLSAISPTPGVRENGTQEGGGVNVFATGGRRLQDLSEKVIQDSCNNAACLIMALGFNDNPLNGSGQEVGRAAFTQRIDWIIQYCNQYDTPLIVPDFSWKNTASSFTRSELKRLATATGGIYIPFPDMIKSGTFPTEAERLATAMWQDAAHPNKAGHKWIAESISKAIGLGCTSKLDAISLHDYWVSLPLTSTYKNILTNIPRNLSAYKLSGGFMQVRTQIALSAGGNIPSGLNNICGLTANSMFWIIPPVKFIPFPLTKTHDISENDGSVRGYSVFYGSGTFKGLLQLIIPASVTSASMNGASSFEIERFEAYDNV